MQDFLNWQESEEVLKKVQLNFEKSVVPLTIGNRRRNPDHTENTTLVMIFKDDYQNERTTKMIEQMQSNQSNQTELIKTRELSLDASDAERIFNDQTIVQNVRNGPIIVLQV